MDVVEIRSSIEIFSAADLPPNLTRDTKRDMVGYERDVNRALQFPIIEPPVCTLNIATQIIDWGLWTDQHRAAQGIASEESALWSFENLYAGKIKGRNIGTEGRQRNIGEICDDAGRGLAKRNLPDTAQGNGGIFFASFGSSPETRGDRVDVGNGLNGTARQCFS